MRGLFDFDLNFDPIEVADIPSTDAVEVVVLPVPTPATALVQIVNGAPLPSPSFAVQRVESGGVVAELGELQGDSIVVIGTQQQQLLNIVVVQQENGGQQQQLGGNVMQAQTSGVIGIE
jgi:hypothetical protein